MLPEPLRNAPARRVRLGLLAALVVAVVAAVGGIATAAVTESCTGGTPLGGLVANDGDQCGDDTGGEERDWEALAGDFATYTPNPSNPPPAPAGKGIAVPDDITGLDESSFVTSGKEKKSSDWDFGESNVNDKVNLYGTWAFPESIGTDLFLYLAFQRQAPNDPANASANVDFELNQAPADEASSYVTNANGEKVIKRQGDGVAGGVPDDLLFVYDWSGNKNIALELCRWEAGADNVATNGIDESLMDGEWKSCAALDATKAQGEVNDAGNITGFLPGAVENNAGEILRRQFGEASINLTAALGIGADECVSFGAFSARTRESPSINATLVDAIPPAPVKAGNCGTVVVEKQTDPDDAKTTKTDFGFTTTGIPVPPATGTVTSVDDFDLADDEQQTISNVEPNSGANDTAYDVAEDALDPTSDYIYDRTECVSDDASRNTGGLANGATYTPADREAHVKVAAGETITCTFYNTEKGSVAIEKVTDPDPDPSDPDTDFTFQAPGNLQDVTVANGQTSSPQAVEPGQYTFTEDAAPGWAFDSVDCDDDNSASPSSGGGGDVDFDVDPGEDVVCTVVNVLEPSGIDIVKTGPATAYHGDQVTFTFTVTNPSVQSLHDVVVTDDRCSPVTLSGKQEGANDTGANFLDPGDTWTYTCTTTIPPHEAGEQDPRVNVGTVNAKDERNQPVSDDDPHSTDLLHVGIALDKSGPAEAVAGQDVGYDLVVTNTGDTSMAQANVNFVDPRCDLVAPIRTGTGPDTSPDFFDPGDVWSYRCAAMTAVGMTEVHNVADVCGTDVNGRQACANDDARTVLRQPVQGSAPQRAQPGAARMAGPTRCVRGPFSLRVTGRQIRSVTAYVGKRKIGTRSGPGNFRVDARKLGYDVQAVRVVVRFTTASGTRSRTLRAAVQRCPRQVIRPKFTG